MPAAPLFTERLIIRRMTLDDMDCLWEMDSDPDVMAHVGIEAYRDEKFFRKEMTREFNEGRRFKFFRMIADRETGAAVGWLLFRPTEDGERIEIGWRLVKRAWGRGYVPEACLKLTKVAMAEWGLEGYMAILEAENTKSSRVCEKLGMTYQGKTSDYHDLELDIWTFEKDRQN